MPRSDRHSLEHMFESATRLRTLAGERGRATFDDDEAVRLAMLHLIQRLGEAASRLSAEFRATHAEFPWAEMIGMRNRIVHSYDDLDADIIWRVASDDVEPIIAALERALVE